MLKDFRPSFITSNGWSNLREWSDDDFPILIRLRSMSAECSAMSANGATDGIRFADDCERRAESWEFGVATLLVQNPLTVTRWRSWKGGWRFDAGSDESDFTLTNGRDAATLLVGGVSEVSDMDVPRRGDSVTVCALLECLKPSLDAGRRMLWTESFEVGALGAGDTGWLRDADNLVGVVAASVLEFDHLMEIKITIF